MSNTILMQAKADGIIECLEQVGKVSLTVNQHYCMLKAMQHARELKAMLKEKSHE